MIASTAADEIEQLHLALLRKIALNLARTEATRKVSLKGKRKSAAWDNSFMAALIAG